MKAVLQRVTEAAVSVDNKEISRIGPGWLILLGIHKDDSPDKIPALGDKIASLRGFCDEAGKMNLNIQQISGSLLIVSQFTLFANCRKGNRPSFFEAAPPELAKSLYLSFIDYMRSKEIPSETGSFGAKMAISIQADGPVTLTLENS